MTENTERYEQLKTIVKQYLPDDVDVAQIRMESNFTEDLNINSANLVDVVLDVEDEFDILLENEDMDGMKTVEDALRIIDGKVNSTK
ncbi:MAG: acyl carrier protein [Bacteroidota bacterium]